MILVSQNKERVLWFGRAFNALEYNEDISIQSVFLTAALKKLQSMKARSGVWKSYRSFARPMRMNATQ